MAREDVTRTIAAYDAHAQAYAAAQPPLDGAIRRRIDDFARLLGDGAHVLEIGSGGGRDALALESHGLVVDRTDITPAFVELLRGQGHSARVLDPLTGDLGRDVDGVWAQACLLHVDRPDLPVVLTRLRAATRPGGLLYVSLKEGDGEAWSTHGAVAGARRFTYWREAPLRDVLAASGWDLLAMERQPGKRADRWLEVLAVNR